mmetsp:Transcript_46970/g.87454  ORF Transcript_46970/g.87454 Transcript_46970/m.87454 type:complete len:1286 (-) Transcript_46970:123-3980(-)
MVVVSFNGTEQETKIQYGSQNPTWNEEAKVPFAMPCWDDSVGIILKSAGRGTGSAIQLEEFSLSITSLLNVEMHPTWFNLYYSPDEEENSGTFTGSEGDEELSAFGGRILIAATVERSEKPHFNISSCAPMLRPTSVGCLLWADLYQICFDSTELPAHCKVQITMKPIPDEWEFGEPDRHAHAFVWEGEVGRMTQVGVQIPPVSMAPDLFVTVLTKPEAGVLLEGSWTRHMFARIPISSIYNWEDKLEWIEMKLCLREGNHRIGGFALMRINMGPELNPPRRPPRKNLTLENYLFRAMIYQAVNCPCMDDDGTVDPRVVLFFGSAQLSTQPIYGCVNPVWHRVLEEAVELPNDPELRPDIYIYIVDQDDSGIEPIAQKRYSTCEALNLPEKWEGPPRWISLEKMPDGPHVQGKILVAFELVPMDGEQPDLRESIKPEAEDCRIEIFTIGVRMNHGQQDISEPWIEYSHGRDVDGSPMKTKVIGNRAGEEAEGSNGHFNFLSSCKLNAPLAKDPVHQEYMEVKLLSSTGDGGWQPKAFASFHLTPLLPWVDKAKASAVENQFKVMNYEELKIQAEREAAVMPGQTSEAPEKPIPGAAKPGGKKKWNKVNALIGDNKGMTILETRLANAIGWNHPSIEASNKTVLGMCKFANITDEDKDTCRQKLHDLHITNPFGWSQAKAKARASKFSSAGRRSSVGSQNSKGTHGSDVSSKSSSSKSSSVSSNLSKDKDFDFNWNNGKDDDDSSGSDEGLFLGPSRFLQNVPEEPSMKDVVLDTLDAFQTFHDVFQWPKHEDDGDDALDGHPECDGEMETNGMLADVLLPYLRAPLIVGSPTGEQMTIGTLKLCCRILTQADYKEGGPRMEAEQEEWNESIEKIKEQIKASESLSVRAYLLSADGIIPSSGRSDPHTYLWSRTTAFDSDKGNCDDGSVRKHSLHPEFFKAHVFDKVKMPQHCQLQIKVIEQVPSVLGGIAEEKEVGSTLIDIEDRWFHPHYQKFFAEDAVPIEARPLRKDESAFNRGHCRLWLEVMTNDIANKRPLTNLPSSDPRQFQLRIVIWRATNVIFEREDEPDVYVVGKHTLDDGTILTQETDTHYGCDDETATFNWRWLFDIQIPCQDPRLSIMMWDHNLVSSSEPIADATMDLSRDFLQAKKKNDIVELPRGEIPMTHPTRGGEVNGRLELEGVLIPMEEAVLRPVGAGRDEPNEDPFLDPDDKHLAGHRSAVGNLEAVKNLKYVGGMLFAGFGMMTALYVVGAVIGGVVSFGFTIYMVTRNTGAAPAPAPAPAPAAA